MEVGGTAAAAEEGGGEKLNNMERRLEKRGFGLFGELQTPLCLDWCPNDTT